MRGADVENALSHIEHPRLCSGICGVKSWGRYSRVGPWSAIPLKSTLI